MTTCKSRLDTLLPKTLASLAKAGFDDPRLFIDGADKLPKGLARYEKTVRSPPLRTYGNWWASAWELYLRNPHANRYAIFQDDLETVAGLREYLDSAEYPDRGYLNLYTFPENEKDDRSGFFPSNQMGRGAVALVFDSVALRTLFGLSHMINRPMSKNPKRPAHKFVDGAIVSAMRKAGFREFVHGPSLTQHIGDRSSMGNRRHPKAKSFPGKNFDARSLISRVKITRRSHRKRVGIVGYHAPTGIGEQNRQLATFVDVDRWLIAPHPTFGITKQLHPDVESTICRNGAKLRRWLGCVDVALFSENPFFGSLGGEAKSMGKRTVCVPNHEWFPSAGRGWPKGVDLFLCPTRHCFDQLSHVVPCELFYWPIDTDRFKFKQRITADRFLYLHGRGGFQGRKGGAVIRKLLDLFPEIPLTIVSQTREAWPDLPNLRVLGGFSDNSELYSLADVLIAPHSVDGIGLEPLEAMSAGMPVITTDGEPWNENPALARIPASVSKKTVKRPIDWFSPDPEELSRIVRETLGSDIAEHSRDVREWAERRSWGVLADRFTELVRG